MNMLSLLGSLLTLALVCAPTWRLLHSFSDVAISDGVLPLDATGAESNESVAKVLIERAADVDPPGAFSSTILPPYLICLQTAASLLG
jgi:hypothetical protein